MEHYHKIDRTFTQSRTAFSNILTYSTVQTKYL
jgi:hypothetical protein